MCRFLPLNEVEPATGQVRHNHIQVLLHTLPVVHMSFGMVTIPAAEVERKESAKTKRRKNAEHIVCNLG